MSSGIWHHGCATAIARGMAVTAQQLNQPCREGDGQRRHQRPIFYLTGSKMVAAAYQHATAHHLPSPLHSTPFHCARMRNKQIDERVEDAAGMISMLDDLRPVDRSFNAFAEVWTRIARIPPEARIRLLQEVEPGGWATPILQGKLVAWYKHSHVVAEGGAGWGSQ